MADVDDVIEEEEELDTGDDSGADDDAGDDGKPAAKPKPVAPKKPDTDPGDEAKALQEMALKKANREARERRAKITELEATVAQLKEASASENERAILAATRNAELAAEQKWRPTIARWGADAALTAAGCTDGASRDLLLKALDLTAVELGDDGAVVGGIDDQVAELKVKYPAMFAPPAASRRVASAREVDAGNKQATAVKKTVAQQLVDAMMKGQPKQ